MSSLRLLHGPQLFSVRQYNFAYIPDRRAAFGRASRDRDLIACLQRIPGPAGSKQLAWTDGFASPMHDLALIVLDIEDDLNVRVHPQIIGYDSFDGDRGLVVVRGVSVMGEQRGTDHQESRHQEYINWDLRVHVAPQSIVRNRTRSTARFHPVYGHIF